MLRLVAAGLLWVACGSGDRSEPAVVSSPPPATADDASVEAAIRSIGTIADLAAKHGANCDALAVDLAAHAQRDSAVIAAFQKIYADPTKQKAIAAKFGERIQQVAKASVASLRDHCAKHQAVQEVFKKMQ